MKAAAITPSYKIAQLANVSIKEQDFEFQRFEYFINNRSHLKHPHRHDHFALFFITKGKGCHVIDFEDYELEAKRVFIVAPGQVHVWRAFEGVEGFVLLFTKEFFTLTLQYRELRAYLFNNMIYQQPYLDLDKDTAARLQQIFLNIERECVHVKKYSQNIIRSYINIILFELTTAYEQSVPLSGNGDIIQLKIREFENMVNKNFKAMRSVTDYAAELHITANYLNAICKKRKGKSAGEIIRDRLMLEARRLLTHSESSIAQVAYDLNFEDNSYFGRFFKKYSGQTPAAFRNEIKKGNF